MCYSFRILIFFGCRFILMTVIQKPLTPDLKKLNRWEKNSRRFGYNMLSKNKKNWLHCVHENRLKFSSKKQKKSGSCCCAVRQNKWKKAKILISQALWHIFIRIYAFFTYRSTLSRFNDFAEVMTSNVSRRTKE